MQSPSNHMLSKKRNYILQYGIPGIVILLIVLWGIRLYYTVNKADRPLSIADVLVMQVTSTSQSVVIVDNIKSESDIVRIQWYEQIYDTIRPRDTVLIFGSTGNEEEVIKQILARAQALNPEQIQEALKRIVWGSSAIEIDPLTRNWSLVLVGNLLFKENLIDAEETKALQQHSKLNVLFFRNPSGQSPGVDALVSDEFTRLLRKKGITVKEVLLR